MTAPTEGPRDARKWTTYDAPGGYTVDAHEVTEDTAGDVMTPGNITRKVSPGDVLVKTDRPDVFNVYGRDAFNELGAKEHADTRSAPPTVDPDAPDSADQFNPDERTAKEVKDYLSRTDLTTAERERVERAERAGQNRSSAFPR